MAKLKKGKGQRGKTSNTVPRVPSAASAPTPPVIPAELLAAVPLGWKLRKIQADALVRTYNALQNPANKYVVLEAPGGTGKTLIAVTLAQLYSPAAIATSTVQLQEQYLRDFGRDGMKVLKGKRHFRCARAHDTCEIGGRLKLGCTDDGGHCPYAAAKADALAAPLVTANYHSFWRHMPVGMKGGGGVPEKRRPALEALDELAIRRKLLILDEAHTIESTVLSLASVTVRLADIPVTLPVLPQSDSNSTAYYEWLDEAQPLLLELLDSYNREGDFTEAAKLEELTGQIALVQYTRAKAAVEQTEYIVERGRTDAGQLDETWFSLKPLHVRQVANRLWKSFPKTLFMSATILNGWEFCTALGLNPAEGEFVQVTESFPPANRPIITASLDMSYGARDTAWPQMVTIIENLLRHHDTHKGLILTSSNVMLQYIMQNLNRSLRTRLIPAFGDDRLEKYESHLKAKGPTVLIASGYWEGADLVDDASRFQIIPSAPRAMFSGQVRARTQMEPRWYRWVTWTKMIQGMCRSVRSETDEAVTYVLDRDFEREMEKHDSMIPGWVRVAVQQKRVEA